MSGRRGAVVHALGAIDIALWDICGKAAGVPCWQLWGEAARSELTPYASLQPEVDSFEAYVESMVGLGDPRPRMGFRACKLEATFSGPYVHKGLVGPDERITEVIAAVRGAVGPDMTIMVDVQYAFASVEQALRSVGRWDGLDVFFLETPLWVDDIDGYAELSARSPVPIAAGEWLSTRHDFETLMDHGGVQVAQPDIGRVGGLTEARRVCDMAAERGRLIVPHAWKTGLSVAAAAHLAMVTPHMPFFEFLPGGAVRVAPAQGADARRARLSPTACCARPSAGRDRARALEFSTASALERLRREPRAVVNPAGSVYG